MSRNISELRLANTRSAVVCILLARKTMRCTRRANIHLCLCKPVQACASVYKAEPTIHNYTLCGSCNCTCTHTDTHARRNTREWGSNEVRGDTAGLSVNPQLADTQLTTSMTLFHKQWKPVELHQMQREA